MMNYIQKFIDHETIPPVAELIGLDLIKCEKGYSEFKMILSKKHHNPMGTVHGGIIADISDAAMAMAFASTLNDGELFTTVNLQINFLKSMKEGLIIAKANVYKRGNSIGFVECKVYDENNEIISTSTSVCKVMKIQN